MRGIVGKRLTFDQLTGKTFGMTELARLVNYIITLTRGSVSSPLGSDGGGLVISSPQKGDVVAGYG